jgi:hypothetical protein
MVEKPLQIPKMRDIYSKSQKVVIWLGEEAPEDEGSLHFAATLEDASRRHDIPIEQGYAWAFPNDYSPRPDDRRWKKFFTLFTRPWFSRLWIIQEVALSNDAEVLCGGAKVGWDTLMRALKYSGMLGIQLQYFHSMNLNAVRDLEECRQQYLAGTPSSLAKLLARRQESLATDSRDKIYGLMGIADQANIAQLNITPDCSTTVEDLYRNFAVAAIRASNNLDVFQAIRSRDPSAPSLPSWVPDWSVSQHFVTLRHSELAYPDNAIPELQSQGFHCTGDSRASPALAGDGNILGLQGHLIGAIGEVSCPLALASGAGDFYDFQYALQDWERVARARSGMDYYTGESMMDCYWQTLCAAVMPGGFQSCQEEFRRYDAVFQTLRSFANPIRSLRLEFLPLAKATAMVLGLIYHNLFRSNALAQDIAGFSGQNGAMYGRRMAWSTTNYMCLVPKGAMEGDSIVVLEGGKVPLVIRADKSVPKKEDVRKLTRWLIVGEAYVHGAMTGDAFRSQQCKRFWFS